jgi:hypothetical protein
MNVGLRVTQAQCSASLIAANYHQDFQDMTKVCPVSRAGFNKSWK